MMDTKNLLSEDQAVETSDVSDNCIDLGAADKQLGINRLILHVVCTTAFTGLDSGLIIHLIDGTGNTTGEIDAGERELNSTGTIAQADFLTAGGHWQIPVPPKKLQQYLGARYEPVSQAGVAGKFTSWFSEVPESEVV